MCTHIYIRSAHIARYKYLKREVHTQYTIENFQRANLRIFIQDFHLGIEAPSLLANKSRMSGILRTVNI